MRRTRGEIKAESERRKAESARELVLRKLTLRRFGVDCGDTPPEFWNATCFVIFSPMNLANNQY